jgi:ribonuclease E
MEEKRNNRNVERRLKDALKNDRARIQVGHISHFGLLEMSRQRLRPGLLEGSSRTCPHCEGRGVVRSISSCGLSVLRAIEEHLIARKPENLTVKCTREIAFYILNEKRDNLLTIETTYGISVFITPSDEFKGSQALIERAPERNIPPRKVMAAPVRMDSAFEEEDEEVDAEENESEVEAEDENGSDETSETSAEDRQNGNGGDREGGRRRRRRRGRRGGRGRDDQPTQDAQGNDIPGLGDQPGFEADEDGDEQPTEGSDEPTEAAPPGEGEDGSEDGERPRRGRGRRDRWGRSRDRDRPRGEDRGRREDRPEATGEPESEAPAAAAVSEPALAPAPTPVSAPQPVVEAPAAAPADPVRRWQPPAPTVTPAAVERKSGWWSKR